MHRYIGLLLVVVIAALLYLVFTQIGPQLHFGNVLSIFTFPKFGRINATSTTAKNQNIQPKQQTYAYRPTYTPPPPPQPTITPPAGFTLSELSPDYQKVRIGYVSPSYDSSFPSQISLNSGYSLGSGLDITGWRIRTNRGDILIPQAIADYTPSGLTAPSDIVLNSGQTVNIYSSYSPFGRNIRLNECTGFLNNAYNFIPALPDSCPYPDRSVISNFSGACQSYIFSLGSCSEPSADDLNRFGGPNDAGCQQYLSEINYTGCYDRYRSDADFFSNEWRIWLGASLPLDSQHDRVLLFDRRGLLVDLYTY